MLLTNFRRGLARLLSIAALGVASVSYAKEPPKFEGEFWNAGQHFQLTGDVVLIAEDGIHDPTNITAMYGLQLPADAMKDFPRDSAGVLDWVQTLRQGHIAPRSDLLGEGEALKPFDLDIVFENTASMPKVLFSHTAHTEWLACKNCHDDIFVQKKGTNKFNMTDVLNGKYCGVCHGKIAFSPVKNCMRCHSVSDAAPAAAKK